MINFGIATTAKKGIHMHIQNGGRSKLSPKTRRFGYAVSVLRKGAEGMTTTEQKDSHDDSRERKCGNSHCENPIPETTQYYNRWGMRFCSTSCGIDWGLENPSRD